ncbi:restriction endonuclease subunit S [Rothia sp. CCM 9416]|uniref:restriction endonuclease subunit S n=1 Tax=Rothia sp. CCM 9416 TaxID=3402655 RepID=UPI003AE11A3B
MSKIFELIEELCPDGVKHVAMSDAGTFSRGSGIQKKDFLAEGFPAIHYGQIFTLYGLWAKETFVFVSDAVAEKSRLACPGDVVIATTSENDQDLAKAVAWVGESPVAVSSDAMIYSPKNLDAKFVSYFLNSTDFQIQKGKFITGTKVRRISLQGFSKIKIPVPPLEVQEEIVRILDKFTLLEAELEAELEARAKQYRHILRKMINSENNSYRKYPLAEIGSVKMCKRVLKKDTSPIGDIPFYKIGTFGGKEDSYISKDLFDELRVRYPYPKRGDLLISASGTIGRVVEFDGSESYFQDSNIVWIDNDESIILNSYLKYIYMLKPWKAAVGGTISRLYNDIILKTVIEVPPSKSEQQYIVSVLDRFDALVNDISSGLPAEIAARRKQYEYYRDKLLTFKELPQPAPQEQP